MIFLSAQPDEFFFTWQIEVQILNFRSLGIRKEDYHILIGIDSRKGLSLDFCKIIEKYSLYASFYIYKDTRKDKVYVPSIRPHIIKKHFTKYPQLVNEAIFYHDSDVILRKLPFSESMLSDSFSYVSDTRNYLDSNYVISTIGEKGLSTMCAIAGITPQQAIGNDSNCGGAQYILKNTDTNFWKKIEYRCKHIYEKLSNINALRNYEQSIKDGVQTTCPGIQAWCADMWAIFYTMIEEKRAVRISEEMTFCWSDSPIIEWEKCAILHYTGNQELDTPIFKKNLFKQYSPVYDAELMNVSQTTCGYKVVEYIHQLENSFPKYELEDTLFIFQIPKDFEQYNILTIVLEYLSCCFSTNFIMFIPNAIDNVQKTRKVGILSIIDYCKNKHKRMVKYKTNGIKYVVEYPYNAIIRPDLICDAILALQQKSCNVSALQMFGYAVDKLLTQMFYKLKDIDLLYSNIGKMRPLSNNSLSSLNCFSMNYYLDEYISNQRIVKSDKIQKQLDGEFFCLS